MKKWRDEVARDMWRGGEVKRLGTCGEVER